MPLEAGAVMLLEVRPASRQADAASLESILADARVLLEAQAAGRAWTRSSGDGVSGTVALEDPGKAFFELHRLRTELRADSSRPGVHVVAGIGRGDAVEASRRAGRAFRSLSRRGHSLTCALTADDEANVVLGALCRTMDSLISGWTDAQWQAIRRRDRGRTLQQIGAEIGIAYQNVSKRLIAAHYDLYGRVLEAARIVFLRAGNH